MTCDVLLVGAGPLPRADSTLLCSYNFRTAKLASWLAAEGICVRAVAVDLFKSCMRPDGEIRSSLTGDYLLLPNTSDADKIFSGIVQSERPSCILAVSYQAADLVCRTGHDVPVWADMPGWIMAEAQLSAALAHDDHVVQHFRTREQRVVGRADKVSVVSHNQRHATMAELAGQGRLNRRNRSHVLVHRLPSLAFDWRPLLPDLAGGSLSLERVAGLPEDAVVVLWSGSYNIWTEMERIFAYTEELMRRVPNVHYVSTGGHIPGYNDVLCDRLHDLVGRSSHRERYHLLPWQGFQQALQWYQRAALGVCIDGDNLEIDYGSRTRLVDMLSHGLPAATTPGTELGSDLAGAGAVVTLCPDQPESWAEATARKLGDSAALQRLASSAREYIYKHYSLPVVGSELLQWLRNPEPAPDNAFKWAIAVSGFRSQNDLTEKDNRFWHSRPLIIWQPQPDIDSAARKALDPYPPGRASRRAGHILQTMLKRPVTAVPTLVAWAAASRVISFPSMARWQSRMEVWLKPHQSRLLEQSILVQAGKRVYSRSASRPRSLSDIKTLNVLLARHEYDCQETLLCRPQRIEIEPSSACNIRCNMCVRNNLSGQGTLMPMAVFQKIIPLLPYTALLEIIGAGEPTLNPQLHDVIEIASHFDCYIRMFTNATRLTPELSARLVLAQVGGIVFSLPAGNAVSYHRVTGLDCFADAVENMRTLRDVKRHYHSRFPRLQVNCALTSSALQSAPEAVRIASEIGCDDISFSIACISREELESESVLSIDAETVRLVFGRCRETAERLGIRITLPPWPDEGVPAVSQPTDNHFGCLLPWQNMLVRSTGLVEVCTYNRRIVGDLNRESPEQIWNGKAYREFRKGPARHQGNDHCETCYLRAMYEKRVSHQTHLAYGRTCEGYR